MVTALSPKQELEKGRIIQRFFDYNIQVFYQPYEDLMIIDNPIHQHLVTLNFIVKELKLKEVLELGTQAGNSTVALGCAVRDIGGHLTSIDLSECPIASRRMGDRALNKIWTLHEKTDDLKIKWNKKIDCLFIDSQHTEEQMAGELEKFYPFLKTGGYLIMHDVCKYNNQGMGLAIQKFFNLDKVNYYRWFNSCGLGVIKKR